MGSVAPRSPELMPLPAPEDHIEQAMTAIGEAASGVAPEVARAMSSHGLRGGERINVLSGAGGSLAHCCQHIFSKL